MDELHSIPTDPEYLSLRDVSKLTGLNPKAVRERCVSGKYNADKTEGENAWRIKSEQFKHLSNWKEFLKERKNEIDNSKIIATHALELWRDETSL